MAKDYLVSLDFPRQLNREIRKSNRFGDCFFVCVHFQKVVPFDISVNKKSIPLGMDFLN